MNLLVLLWVGGKHLNFEENRQHWWFKSNVVESGFIRYSDTYGFMGQNVSDSAQKCGPTVYQVWKRLPSASEVDFDAIWDHYEKNVPFMRYVHAYVFMGPINPESIHDGDLTVPSAVEDVLGTQKDASEMSFGAILDRFGEKMPFMRYVHAFVFMAQINPEGGQGGKLAPCSRTRGWNGTSVARVFRAV